MTTKTDDATLIGKHKFELAGLGQAPFKFVGMSENVISYADGTTKAGGCCAYCYTGIRYECIVQSKDGKTFKVGSDCINKVGDAGLMKAYKTSPEYREHQKKLRDARNAIKRAKDLAVHEECKARLQAHRVELSSLPHSMRFTDRETGRALTAWDQAKWFIDNTLLTHFRTTALLGIKNENKTEQAQ